MPEEHSALAAQTPSVSIELLIDSSRRDYRGANRVLNRFLAGPTALVAGLRDFATKRASFLSVFVGVFPDLVCLATG